MVRSGAAHGKGALLTWTLADKRDFRLTRSRIEQRPAGDQSMRSSSGMIGSLRTRTVVAA